MLDQAAKLRELARQRTTTSNLRTERCVRVIAVTSGKGGVGKSNITVNLALALVQLGKRVLIMDVDLGTANVDLLLGCSAKYDFSDMLNRSRTISEIVAEGPGGIRYVSGGSGISQLADLTDTDLFTITAQLTQLDDWADIILMDTGAGISRNVLHFVTCADEAIVVTTPEPPAMTDAYAIIKTIAAKQPSLPVKLIVNRVQSVSEAREVSSNLMRVCDKFLSFPITELGYVHEDAAVRRAVRQQKPFYLQFPNAEASKCVTKIADLLVSREHKTSAQGFKGFLYRFMEQFW